jgi:hypothetical protein
MMRLGKDIKNRRNGFSLDHMSETADGQFQTVDVPPSVKRFDEIKVGDQVNITWNTNVTVAVE